MDLTTVLLAVGVLTTIVVWVLVLTRRRAQFRIAARGLAVGLIVAAAIWIVIVVLVTIGLNGRPFLFGSALDLAGAFGVGVLLGSIVAGGYLWLDVIVLGIGLLFRPGDSWAIGAAAATPVLVAAVGFGFTAFNAYQFESQKPTITQGTAILELDGARLGHASASGVAACEFHKDGVLRIDATPLASDGRATSIQFAVSADGEVRLFAVSVGDRSAGSGKGWELGASTTALDAGWSGDAGTLRVRDVVPLDDEGGEPDPTERWSGSLSWTCPPG